MVAVTFAEAGEYDEARKILNEPLEETPGDIQQEAQETAWNGNQAPDRIEIHYGGFYHNHYYDFYSRYDAAGYAIRVLVKDIMERDGREEMKYPNSIDWKYVLLISLILISVLMTVLGLNIELF